MSQSQTSDNSEQKASIIGAFIIGIFIGHGITLLALFTKLFN